MSGNSWKEKENKTKISREDKNVRNFYIMALFYHKFASGM